MWFTAKVCSVMVIRGPRPFRKPRTRSLQLWKNGLNILVCSFQQLQKLKSLPAVLGTQEFGHS